MKTSGSRPIAHARRGFTIIELIVSFVIGLIVLASVVQMMIVQGKSYRKQREQVDVRETTREAAALLSWDLRQAAVAGSPFVAMGPNNLTIRSPRGLGTICARGVAVNSRFGLWKTAGNILATADDTALVYQIGKGTWLKAKITAVGTPAAMGVVACAWPGARPPDVVVEFGNATAAELQTVFVGAPFRSFRSVQYAEYQQNGRWWLGRKVGQAAGYEQLTGPLLAPASNGLAFTYYDTLGAVSANTNAIGSVAFTIRTESYKNATTGSTFVYQRDSLTTRVGVRR
ncbi:MAG TPA: prepilin-type N-terminal cleavage/methylation domain-containing protein [Gemmatimonadaceae bacterium]|nr:prepilin-type N-terminal cleavage/methylation domain-containing protein [Gemmatimonadaceae bacterium]